MYVPHFICLLIEGHELFPFFLTIMNNAALTICVQVLQ